MPLFKNTSPVEKPKRLSLWKRLMNFTASDKDYVPDVHEQSIKVAVKPVNVGRRIRAFIIVVGVFYLLLCAFILLNPQYALFFNNIFGIEYLTVRKTLELTIYAVYSIFAIILGVGLIFFWYRAITIKTNKKSKRYTVISLAVLFGLLFFGNIALFAWTYNWFLNNFDNLDGSIIVYDNTYLKYLGGSQDLTRARISTDTSIGPIHVRYDLSGYIKKEARTKGLLLSQPYEFEIDYDGDRRPDRGSGENNGININISDAENAPIIAPENPYDKIGVYKPTATIKGIDVAGNPITVEIDIPEINLEGIVDVGRTNLENGGIQYTFNADSLATRGQMEWSILGRPGSEYIGSQYSPDEVFTTPTIICLKIYRGTIPSATAQCDWRFVTEESNKSNIQNGDIKTKIDPLNPLKYQFYVEPTTLQGDIKSVRWYIDEELYVGKFDSGNEKILDYTFHLPGTYKIEAEIEDNLGNTIRVGRDPVFTAEIVPIKEGYTIKITDESGQDLTRNNYDKKTQSYLLPDFPVPGTLSLDATSIRADSARLSLEKVEWDANGDGVFEKTGFTLDRELEVPGRYEINAKYTFIDISVDGKEIPIVHIDRIAVVGIQKPLDVRVKITPENEYAPTSVRFDASGSKSLKGEIQKFLYNFGDGHTYEGEGVVTTYNYKKPGEYKITVTAVTVKGEKASRSYVLVLKKPQETVEIRPSIASGLATAGLPVTFDTKVQGTDNVMTWNFGDNSGTAVGQSVVHEFKTAGTYTITVDVEYTSGIEESDTITYIVNE